MTPRQLVVVLLLAVTATAPAAELSGRALKKFLGPVSDKLVHWERTVERGLEIYHGVANHPLSGTVDIFICENCSVFGGGGDGEEPFGIFPKFLTRGSGEGGQFWAGGWFWPDQRHHFELEIKSPLEADRDEIVKQISRLPMFNATTMTPFAGIGMRNNMAYVVDCLLLPIFVLLTVFSGDAYLRRKKIGALPRLFLASGVLFADWLLLWFGLLLLVRLWRSTGAIFYVHYTALIAPAVACVSFVLTTLIIVFLLIQRLVRSKIAAA